MSTYLSRARAAQRRKDNKLPKIHTPRKGRPYNPPPPPGPAVQPSDGTERKCFLHYPPFSWLVFVIAVIYTIFVHITARYMRNHYF